MAGQGRDNALDHVVVVVFENRSLDNVLGRLYGPEDGKTFEGVTRQGPHQPDPGMGRARRRPQGGAVHGGHRHGQPQPRHRGGVPAHQHPAVQHPQRGEPVQARRGDLGAVQRPGAGPGADDGRLRHRLHQHANRRAGPPAHLRGVLAGDDRVHPGTDPGAQRAGARVRRVRPLVLRGAVADVHQPVVLDRRDRVGVRGERAGQELAGGQHRRDDLQPA